MNRDVDQDLRILPIWHGVSRRTVAEWSPSLSDKVAIDTQRDDAQEAAIKIFRTVRPDLYGKHSRAEHERLASGTALVKLQNEIEELRKQIAEYQCPHCEASLSTRVSAPLDEEEKHWDTVETYECGLRIFGGMLEHPCPSDPNFPSFGDYRLVCKKTADGKWRCDAWARTEMARLVTLDSSYGTTETGARNRMEATYLFRAGRMTNQEWFRIQMSPQSP